MTTTDRYEASRVDVSRHTDVQIEATIEQVLAVGLGSSRGPRRFVLDIIEVCGGVQKILGYDDYAFGGNDFEAMCKRALERLARRGAVVKVKRGDEYMTVTGPRRNGGRWALWMSPDTAARIQDSGEEYVRRAERNQQALDERVAKLRDWAEIQGLDISFDARGAPVVDLDTLETILVRLAREER